MAVVQRGRDIEQGLDGSQRVTVEDPTDQLDLVHRQRRQVGKRALLDLLAVPVGLAEKNRRPGTSVGHYVDVHAHIKTIENP